MNINITTIPSAINNLNLYLQCNVNKLLLIVNDNQARIKFNFVRTIGRKIQHKFQNVWLRFVGGGAF